MTDITSHTHALSINPATGERIGHYAYETDAQMDAAREAIRAQRKYDMRPLNFTCPSCGSKPGESCYGNGPMREPHFIRGNPEPVEERYARAALRAAFATEQRGENRD